MINPMRSLTEVTLGNKTYKARLTIDAIVQIEQAVGCGIIKLATKMSEGDISVSDMITILTPALRGGGNDVQQSDVTKIIQSAGIVPVTTVVANLLTQTLMVEEDPVEEDPIGSSEKKEAPEKKPEGEGA